MRVLQLVQAPCKLELGSTDPRLRGQRLERPVGDARRLPEGRDLLVVLDRANRVDDPTRRDELCLAGRQPLPLEVRQYVGLELHRALELLADVDRQRTLRHHDRDTGNRLGRLGVAKVGVQRRLTPGLHEQRGIRAVESAEIEDVRQVRDEERRFEPLSQRCEARHGSTFPARYSSASR